MWPPIPAGGTIQAPYQRTLMTLWGISRSPLMFGGDLRDNDPWPLALMPDQRVLDLQRSGSGNRQPWRRGDRIRGNSSTGERVAWTAQGERGQTYLALFNLGETDAVLPASYDEPGRSGPVHAEELWSGKVLNSGPDALSASVPPHGVRVFELT